MADGNNFLLFAKLHAKEYEKTLSLNRKFADNSVLKLTHLNHFIMVKRTLLYLSAFIVISFLAASCEPEATTFDEALLIGKWQSGTLYYKYLADGTGGTWDTSDDVTEAEAQPFTWTLVKAELTHIHILETGGTVPKIYTVTELTETSLRYHDDFGSSFSFTKIAR
jgi:hypothetical protein